MKHKRLSSGEKYEVFEMLYELLRLEKISCPSKQFQFTSGMAMRDLCWNEFTAHC